jgi:hypothetical protein
MEKVSPPVRILALVLVLVGVAGMLAMRTMGPSAEPEAVPVPARAPAKKAAVAPVTTPAPAKAAAVPAVTAPKAKAVARTSAAAKAKPAPKPVNPVVPRTGFPLVVDEALQQHEVVVVALVVPGARVDELAAAEAEAGAGLGDAGFVALNVLNERVARSLLAKVDGASDPSVLVVTREGEVALEFEGFVDRETVAQAAANASA